MNRRKFLKIALLGTTFMGLGVYNKKMARMLARYAVEDGKYDFDEFLIDNYDELVDVAVKFDTKTKKGPFKSYGVGFMHNKKLLTANHIINGDWEVFLDGEEGEAIYKDSENDLAVLEFPHNVTDRYPTIPLGDSDELEVGHLVTNVGIPKSTKRLMRHRRIISKDGCGGILTSNRIGDENVYMTWYGLQPGDSGCPSFAFRDGDAEVVGMGKSLYGPISEFHKINHIKDKLNKYL